MTRPAWVLSVGLAVVCLGVRAEAAAVTVDVTVNEPVTSVTVNGVAATLTGSVYSAPGVSLSLGPNTITATATDPAGNSASTSITVHLGAKVNVQGTADASVTAVTVNGIPAPLTAGTFSALIPMTLGVNTVTTNAQDAAGNASSKTSRVFLARPPVPHP